MSPEGPASPALAGRTPTGLNVVSRALTLPLLALIRLYQWTLSPLLGEVCRYHPSCSRYGFAAIRQHGALVGGFLTVRRVLRCNPWMPGGIDEVPTRGRVRATLAAQRAEGRARRAGVSPTHACSTNVRGA